MSTIEWINLVFFLFFIMASWLRPLTRRRRIVIAAIGGTGIALLIAAQLAEAYSSVSSGSVVRDWLPMILLPMMYWQSGSFAGMLNAGFQQTLQELDKLLLKDRLTRLSKSSYRWLFTCFELAYLSCYLLIPLSLGVFYLAHLRRYIPEYWLVVLLATYPCYAVTAFVQTLPPRLVEADANSSRLRKLNLWVIQRVTTRMNTFPSGHVTATLGGSLVLLHYVPAVGLAFVLISIGIAIGAVTGRYHYATDVLLAVALVVVAYFLVRLFF